MPIRRITSESDLERETSVDVFHVQESIEVYDGALALAIDHLMNHIKALVSQAYLPGAKDLETALKRHPVLKRMRKDPVQSVARLGGRTPDRVLLKECQHLLESVVEIAHLAAWPETLEQAQMELEILQREVPFLDYRYDNDPYPSDRDHEEK
jgi:hypothetical protein